MPWPLPTPLLLPLAALLVLAGPGPARAFATFDSGTSGVSDATYAGTAIVVETATDTVQPPQTVLNLTGAAIVGPEEDVTIGGNSCADCVFDPSLEGQGLRVDAGGGGLLDVSTFSFAQRSGSLVTIDGALVSVLNDVPAGSTNFADAVTVGGGAVLTLNAGQIGREVPITGDVTLQDTALFEMNGGVVWDDVSATGFAQAVLSGGTVAGDVDAATGDRALLELLNGGEAQLVLNGALLNDVGLSDQATMWMTSGLIADDLELIGASRADILGGRILGADETPVTSQPTLDVQGASLLVLYGDDFVVDGVPIDFASSTDSCVEGVCVELGFADFGLPSLDVDGDNNPDFNGIAGHLANETSPFSALTLRVGDPLGSTAMLRLVQTEIVPEPGTALLLGAGLLGLVATRRRPA